MSSKPSTKFSGKGMLAQQAAQISKMPSKSMTQSILQATTSVSPVPAVKSETPDDVTGKRKRGAGAPRTAYAGLTPAEAGQSTLSLTMSAIDHLKKKGGEMKIDQLTSLLSLRDEDRIREVVSKLRGYAQNDARRVKYTPPAPTDPDVLAGVEDWRLGTYSFVSLLPGVHDKESLVAYLQNCKRRINVTTRAIKDGWPDYEQGLHELEKEGRIVVWRNKDNKARLVRLDIPGFQPSVDPATAAMWDSMKSSSRDDTIQELSRMGLKPSTLPPKAVQRVNRGPKKRASAAPKKTTNAHMKGLLRDYSSVGKRAV